VKVFLYLVVILSIIHHKNNETTLGDVSVNIIWLFLAGIGDVIRFGWFLENRNKKLYAENGIHQDWQAVTKDIRCAAARLEKENDNETTSNA
jgi:hypothetical protein